MKLKDFKEYLNSLPSDMDDLEVVTSYYDMEKGVILKNVECLNPIRYKEKESVFVDSFDGIRYKATIKEETLDLRNGTKALKVGF